eukprot:799387-Prymnesium_polylepis.1
MATDGSLHDAMDDGSVSWLAYTPEDYEQVLERKVASVRSRFSDMLGDLAIDVNRSPAENYRQRCRFAVRRFDGRLSYALFDHGAPNVPVDTFPLGSRAINELMPRLMAALNDSVTLGAGLAAVHFLSTQAGDMLVSLIYGEPLAPGWRDAALALRASLGVPALLGRAKGVTELVDRD